MPHYQASWAVEILFLMDYYSDECDILIPIDLIPLNLAVQSYASSKFLKFGNITNSFVHVGSGEGCSYSVYIFQGLIL